ncbi:hypothetical protein KR038_004430 [Drosophila bunnanda]|nr:hypothetical protein KR038_004430 [Drosophila bunnanda]
MTLKKQFQQLCGSLFNSPLTRICSGVVPSQYCKEHKCWYMSELDPYSIFQLEAKKSSYLVFFHYLQMSECRTIELLDLHNVLCVNHLNKSKKLFFGFSHRLCFEDSKKLNKNLREYCGAQGYENDSLSGYYYGNSQTSSNVRLLEVRNCGYSLLGSQILVLFLFLYLVLVLCLRLRY